MHPCSDRKKVNGRSGNERISEIIYELTGETRSRKWVASYRQILKGFLYDRLDVNPAVMAQYPNSPSNKALTSQESLWPHRDTTFGQNICSLSLVSRFYETECLDHLASHIQRNSQILRYVSSTDPAQVLAALRCKRITLVEGHMPQSLQFLDLFHTVAIDLWPRDPRRWDLSDRAWGPQTEELLAGLGVTIAASATVRLEMRWVADSERFEREYVGRGRWKRVGEDSNSGSSDRDPGFRRTRYELCGTKSV